MYVQFDNQIKIKKIKVAFQNKMLKAVERTIHLLEISADTLNKFKHKFVYLPKTLKSQDNILYV